MKKVFWLSGVLFFLQVQDMIAQCWQSIAAGGSHTLAIRNDGTLWAWGSNDWGNLGDGTNLTRPQPVQIGVDNDWVHIACGGSFSAAIKSNGTLWTWGGNHDGALGDGSNTHKNSPVQVAPGSFWRTVECGAGHMIGIKADSSLWTWGFGTYGQLGNGFTANVNIPTQVAGAAGTWKWKSASGGFLHTMAIRDNNTLWSCGNNLFGELGTNNLNGYTYFVPVQSAPNWNWKMVAAGFRCTIGIKDDGTLWGWGYNQWGTLGNGQATNFFPKLPYQSGIDNDWEKISLYYLNTVGLKTDGTLWTWGRGDQGAIGDGTNISKNYPVQIGNTASWENSAGFGYCTTLKNDTLYTWGTNGAYNLGDNTNVTKYVPTYIACTPFALPLSIIYFRGRYTAQNNILLEWQTAMEKEVSGIEIERMNDVGEFDFIGKIGSSGNNAVPHNYSFEDKKPLQGSNYYRLKITDNDGTYQYSEVIKVQNPKTGNIAIFPNPAQDKLFITGNFSGQQLQINIYDLMGKTLLTIDKQIQGQVEVPINDLAPGSYILSFTAEKETSFHRFSK